MGLVKTLIYEGTTGNFKALMDDFLLVIGGRKEAAIYTMGQWKSPLSETLDITYYGDLHASKREAWIVAYDENNKINVSSQKRFATILASETFPNVITIRFFDGVQLYNASMHINSNSEGGSIGELKYQPIGESLILLSQEIQKRSRSEVQLPSASPSPSPSLPSSDEDEMESVNYPGSVAHFRAWMDRFLAKSGKTFKGTWDGHSIEYAIEYYTPAQTTTREVWNIVISGKVVINGKSPSDSHFGMILATEDPSQITIVEFIDGQCYQRTSQPTRRPEPPVLGNAYLAKYKPIGKDFIRIAEWIKAGLEKSQVVSKTVQEPEIQIPLWEQIPDIKWYRRALKLWHEELTVSQISDRLGIPEQTIANRFTELRNQYGEKIVPKRRR